MTTSLSLPTLITRRHLAATLALSVSAFTLAACGGGDTKPSGASSPGATTASSASQAATRLSVIDPWAKAADRTMSAGFATLRNTGAQPVTITGAKASFSPVELHVMTHKGGAATMKKVDRFTVPAHGELVLRPGSNHLMFMKLAAPLKAGNVATVTLTFADGTTQKLDLPVRPYTGANETYSAGATPSSSMPMDHSTMGATGSGHHTP